MTLLDEGPEVYIVPEDDEGRKAFRIDGPSLAAWGVLKVRHLDEADAEDEAAAKEHIQAWVQWLEERKAARQRSREFFEYHLERYALQVREETGEREKNVTTPYGKITTRVVRERWDVKGQLPVSWLHSTLPAMVQETSKPVRTLDVDAVTAEIEKEDGALFLTESGTVVLRRTGEEVPGLTLVAEHLRATVKPDPGGVR